MKSRYVLLTLAILVSGPVAHAQEGGALEEGLPPAGDPGEAPPAPDGTDDDDDDGELPEDAAHVALGHPEPEPLLPPEVPTTTTTTVPPPECVMVIEYDDPKGIQNQGSGSSTASTDKGVVGQSRVNVKVKALPFSFTGSVSGDAWGGMATATGVAAASFSSATPLAILQCFHKDAPPAEVDTDFFNQVVVSADCQGIGYTEITGDLGIKTTSGINEKLTGINAKADGKGLNRVSLGSSVSVSTSIKTPAGSIGGGRSWSQSTSHCWENHAGSFDYDVREFQGQQRARTNVERIHTTSHVKLRAQLEASRKGGGSAGPGNMTSYQWQINSDLYCATHGTRALFHASSHTASSGGEAKVKEHASSQVLDPGGEAYRQLVGEGEDSTQAYPTASTAVAPR